MKTAEEWCEESGIKHAVPTYDAEGIELTMGQIIKQIQLDAWKQGMSDAATIASIEGDDYICNKITEQENNKTSI